MKIVKFEQCDITKDIRLYYTDKDYIVVQDVCGDTIEVLNKHVKINKTDMKVIKFNVGAYFYAIYGENREDILKFLIEDSHAISNESEIDYEEEITNNKWDEKTIEVREDNDIESEPFLVSINDVLVEGATDIVFTNDTSLFD